MPATVTLSTTTLGNALGIDERRIALASTSSVVVGQRLYIDRELMTVLGFGPTGWVDVARGVDGTKTSAHFPGATVYLGRADQFYRQDPVGQPPDAVSVSPYINVMTGDFWFAQGDAVQQVGGTSVANRWWQKAATTYDTTSLGIRTATQNPSSST